MKPRWVLCAALACMAVAHGEPLSTIVLNLEGWQAGRLPGWQVKVNRGMPEISMSRENEGTALRLRARASSFALERSVDVDPARTPFLTWRWKVTELPKGGDFRRARTDDQAAQVLVAFADRRILTYIWDTTAPKGTMQSASSIPLVRIFAVVCQSGAESANRWIRESRNVREDYERAFGRAAPHVKGIRLQINSQHTSTSAESYFGDLTFQAAQ